MGHFWAVTAGGILNAPFNKNPKYLNVILEIDVNMHDLMYVPAK